MTNSRIAKTYISPNNKRLYEIGSKSLHYLVIWALDGVLPVVDAPKGYYYKTYQL